MLASDYIREQREKDPDFRAEYDRLRPRIALAVQVIRLRSLRNLTQGELAQRAGMTQPHVAKIERGDANPTLDTIARLADALGADPGDLISVHALGDAEDAGEAARPARARQRA